MVIGDTAVSDGMTDVAATSSNSGIAPAVLTDYRMMQIIGGGSRRTGIATVVTASQLNAITPTHRAMARPALRSAQSEGRAERSEIRSSRKRMRIRAVPRPTQDL